jgi:hypothetical protein
MIQETNHGIMTVITDKLPYLPERFAAIYTFGIPVVIGNSLRRLALSVLSHQDC